MIFSETKLQGSFVLDLKKKKKRIKEVFLAVLTVKKNLKQTV